MTWRAPSARPYAAALTSVLVRGTSSTGIDGPGVGIGALDSLLGTVAGRLTHAARQAQPPFTLTDVLAVAREDVGLACVTCVATTAAAE